MKRLPFFVYGTLLPDQPNYDLIVKESIEQRPAYFPDGRLYDLGPFPMLLEGSGGLVKGILYSINEADYPIILHRLDALEGFNPRNPTAGDFRRVKRLVNLESGSSIIAWVYLGKPASIIGARFILSGDWIAYSRENKDKLVKWWASWRIGKSG
jgi:gamma-glutamylcyclotransferase (GGCT)/AIG2-like uncharacterized protein YtfP